jgi:hypothetical protein
MSSPHVLDEGVPGDVHPGAAVLLEPSHRSQPRFEAAVIALDAVVGVLIGAVPGGWQELLQHRRVRRRSIGDHLGGHDVGRADRPLEEPVGGTGVSTGGDDTSRTWPNWSMAR